jgi:type IV pilus assembly protein PilF
MKRVLIGMCVAAVVLTACSSPEPKNAADGQNDPAKANANLGLAYMERGEYQVALTKLKKALEINPDLPQAHHYIAEVYQNLGNTGLAEQHFERAVSLDGSDPALQNNYAIFLCRQGRYKEALRHFKRAFDNDNYSAKDQAYENAGLCALRIPDNDKAEEYFRHALDVNARRPESLYQMAELEYNGGRYLQARAFLERLHEAANYSAQSLMLGIQVERKLGDQHTVDQYTQRLKKDFPQSKETKLLMESQHP